jgi:LAS superfamily LD-carboxypeptidase LdcB
MVHIPTSMLDLRDNPLISRKPPVVQAPVDRHRGLPQVSDPSEPTSLLNLANTPRPPVEKEEIRFRTFEGQPLYPIGKYVLSESTMRNYRRMTGGDISYGDTALLQKDAAEAFMAMDEKWKADKKNNPKGHPLPVASAYRNEEHNAALTTPGATNSQHLFGLAWDVSILGPTKTAARDWVKANGGRFGFTFGEHSGNKGHFNFSPPKESP